MIYAREPEDVDELTEEQAKSMLKYLLGQIIDLSGGDFFGSEGWEHFFGFED